MIGFAAIAAQELRITLRRGESVLLTFLIPLGLLVFFGSTDLFYLDIDRFVPGLFALAIVSAAFVGLAVATGFERKYKVLKRFGATPVRRLTLVLAKTAAIAVVEVLQIVVLWVVAAVFFDWSPDMDLDRARAAATEAGVEVDDAWGVGKLAAEVFEAAVEPTLWEPTVVLNYPMEISPLAREHRSRPGVVERFEVIVAGTELANAFSELNDPIEQRRRFEQQVAARAEGDEEAHPMDEDYLRALEYGLPPTGGMGLGVDRLVMILTGEESVREVILFPHLRPE